MTSLYGWKIEDETSRMNSWGENVTDFVTSVCDKVYLI